MVSENSENSEGSEASEIQSIRDLELVSFLYFSIKVVNSKRGYVY